MCQYALFDVGGVEIHSIECIEYCTKDQSNVKDVEDTLYRFLRGPESTFRIPYKVTIRVQQLVPFAQASIG